MKNYLNLFFLLFVLCASLTSSCKKDKESDHEKNVKLITARSWHNTFRGYDNNNDGILALGIDEGENAIAGLDCMLDDNYSFDANSSYKNDGFNNNGNNGCGTNGYSSTWNLADNNEDFSFDAYKGKLEILNDSTIRFYVLIGNEKSYYLFKR